MFNTCMVSDILETATRQEEVEHNLIPTLKKQVGCFNHRVVALVAIMSGLCEVSFGIRDLIALGNQRGSCSGHLTTTILLIVTTTM